MPWGLILPSFPARICIFPVINKLFQCPRPLGADSDLAVTSAGSPASLDASQLTQLPWNTICLLWHPTSSAGPFGTWEMPVEVLPWWSQPSISQNTTVARCKAKCIAAKPWDRETCAKWCSPGWLWQEESPFKQSRAYPKFTEFNGETHWIQRWKAWDPTWDFTGVFDWAYQTQELWFFRMSQDTCERLTHLWVEREGKTQKTEEVWLNI